MSHRTLRRTVAPLAVAHVAGALVQLLTFPYLARVLGPEPWAPILVAQALVAWATILIDHGADLHGPRAIAAKQARHEPLDATLWGIQGAKLTVLPVILLLLTGVMFALPALHGRADLVVWTLVAATARGLSPLWYFQGVERAPRAVSIDTAARIVGALGVLPFVTHPAHGWRVLAAQAVASTIATGWLTSDLARAHPLPTAGLRDAIRTARHQSRALYGQRLALTLFLNANPILLGLLAPWGPLAAYASAERVVRSLTNILAPLSQALVPRASALEAATPDAARQFTHQLLPRVVGVALLLAAGLAVAAPTVVPLLLGPGYEAAVPLLRLFAPLFPIVAASTVIGSSWAVPSGRDALVLRATVAAAITLVGAAALAVPLWGATAMVLATLAAEAVMLFVLGVRLT
jgi:PST family polysaccharide transporter